MSEKDNGGAAYPLHPGTNPDCAHADGMSLRDWFAGQALAGLMSQDTIEFLSPEEIAQRSYEKADAMLEARKK